jgi:hypothetical protein
VLRRKLGITLLEREVEWWVGEPVWQIKSMDFSALAECFMNFSTAFVASFPILLGL